MQVGQGAARGADDDVRRTTGDHDDPQVDHAGAQRRLRDPLLDVEPVRGEAVDDAGDLVLVVVAAHAQGVEEAPAVPLHRRVRGHPAPGAEGDGEHPGRRRAVRRFRRTPAVPRTGAAPRTRRRPAAPRVPEPRRGRAPDGSAVCRTGPRRPTPWSGAAARRPPAGTPPRPSLGRRPRTRRSRRAGRPCPRRAAAGRPRRPHPGSRRGRRRRPPGRRHRPPPHARASRRAETARRGRRPHGTTGPAGPPGCRSPSTACGIVTPRPRRSARRRPLRPGGRRRRPRPRAAGRAAWR